MNAQIARAQRELVGAKKVPSDPPRTTHDEQIAHSNRALASRRVAPILCNIHATPNFFPFHYDTY